MIGGGVVTGPTVEDVIARADALDMRRRLQIAEQIAVINRVLRGGETLNDSFLRQQAELIELRARVQTTVDMLVSDARKPSPVARRVLAILDPVAPVHG